MADIAGSALYPREFLALSRRNDAAVTLGSRWAVTLALTIPQHWRIATPANGPHALPKLHIRPTGGSIMTAQRPVNTVAFQVITGGQTRPANTTNDLTPALPDAPRLDAQALAGDMAELFALALIRDLPLDWASDRSRDRGHRIRINDTLEFTLHDLLCEVHRLPWFSRHAVPSGDVVAAGVLSPPVQGVAGHRAVPLWQGGDGRSFLERLLAGRTAPGWRRPDQPDSGVSALLGECPGRDHDPLDRPAPSRCADLHQWRDWIGDMTGACLPCFETARPVTPRDLAAQTHCRPHMQAAFGAALGLLGDGALFDPSLATTGPTGWSGPRLLALMAQAGDQAQALSAQMMARPGRMLRPGVVATRMTLMQAGEDMQTGPDTDCLHAALTLLNRHCPCLLTWIAALNTQTGTGGFALPGRDGGRCDGWTPLQFREVLMLPQVLYRGRGLHPGGAVGQTLLAGTMATLFKAVFASDPANGSAASLPAPGQNLTSACDSFAANLALGRMVTCGLYPSESRQSLDLGQILALQILRHALEQDGRPAALCLTGFDGQRIGLTARHYGPGNVRVDLNVNGVATLWPTVGGARRPGLSAVV